jgi:hypothetical protein
MNQKSLLEIRNKRAVFVGVNNYSDTSIRSLSYSVADVTSAQELLTDVKRAGYDRANLKLIVDTAEEANMKPVRSNIMSSIKSLAETASGEDSILFFFSGHGIERDGKSYVLPSDSRLNVLEETAVSIGWIREILETSNARVKVIILDACHAGALIGKAESGRMTKAFQESIFPAPEGFAIVSSCKMNEVSYEWTEKGHGVFTYYLNEGLSGFADFDSDGIITVSDISRYVSEKVKNWAFENGVQQNPTLECKISGDIPLINVSEAFRAMPKPQPSEEKDLREYVSKISLMKAWGDYSYDSWAERLCGPLLEFFEPEQISKKGSKYMFPHGYIAGAAGANQMCFEYRSSNWDLIEAIIFNIQHFGWNKIIYDLNVRFNVKDLVKLCKDAKMDIISFTPEEKCDMIVKAEGWGQAGSAAIVTFRSENSTASIEIEQPIYGEKEELESEFFAKLNPKNVLTLLKSSLVVSR